MLAADKVATESLFTATRARVQEIEADIVSKRAALQDMKTHDEAGGSPKPPPPPAPSSTWGAPPPTPPPGAPSLPDGWKRATSPQGREYYYHQVSGETSWTAPVA